MSAYVISEVETRDRAAMEPYRTLAAQSIARYGGRYLARGGAAEVVEGGPPPKTIIIVEFPSMARAREWFKSREYAEALKLRETALERRLMFVEGVVPAYLICSLAASIRTPTRLNGPACSGPCRPAINACSG